MSVDERLLQLTPFRTEGTPEPTGTDCGPLSSQTPLELSNNPGHGMECGTSGAGTPQYVPLSLLCEALDGPRSEVTVSRSGSSQHIRSYDGPKDSQSEPPRL